MTFGDKNVSELNELHIHVNQAPVPDPLAVPAKTTGGVAGEI